MTDFPPIDVLGQRIGAVETTVAGHEGRIRDLEVWAAQFGAEMLGELKRQSELMQQQLSAFYDAEKIRTQDHDTLLRIEERMGPLAKRLEAVEATKRESRITDVVIAFVTAVLGYLGIRFGQP